MTQHPIIATYNSHRVAAARQAIRDKDRAVDKSEADLMALQSVGQSIGELLKSLDEERHIIKSASGPRWIVGARSKVCACLRLLPSLAPLARCAGTSTGHPPLLLNRSHATLSRLAHVLPWISVP